MNNNTLSHTHLSMTSPKEGLSIKEMEFSKVSHQTINTEYTIIQKRGCSVESFSKIEKESLVLSEDKASLDNNNELQSAKVVEPVQSPCDKSSKDLTASDFAIGQDNKKECTMEKIARLREEIDSLHQEETGNNNYSALIKAYIALGNEYFREKQYRKALLNLQNAIDFYSRNSHDFDTDLNSTFSSLALAYYKQEKYAESVNIVKQTWTSYLQKQGKVLPIEMNILLAKSLRKLAKPREALEEYSYAYNEKMKQPETDQREIASILLEMSKVYRNLGDFTKSEQALCEALEIFKKHTGKNDTIRGIIYQEFANIYTEQGHYTKAQKKLMKALSIYVLKYGENNTHTVKCYCSIANLSFRLGEYDKANQEYNKVMTIAKSMEEQDYLLIAKVKKGLGDGYYMQSDYSKAIKEYNDSLEIKKIIYKKDHPDIANIYCVLSEVYCKIQQFEKSANYLEKAEKIYVSYFGENHQTLISVYSLYGSLYLHQNLNSEAIKSYEKTENLCKKIHGEDYTELAPIYYNLASLYLKTFNYVEAKDYYNKALKIKMKNSSHQKAEILKIEDKIKKVDDILSKRELSCHA